MNKIQSEFKADFGFDAPHRTKKECSNPTMADKHLHRIAIMKHEHCGDINDRDKTGVKGWITKSICTGCGKEYLKKQRAFRID